MRYYFIVGEPSGDLHASKVMAGIKKRDSSAEFRFWGGDKMCAIAGEKGMAKHLRQTSFMGFTDVIRNLPTILGQISYCKQDILDYKPDVVVLVDYASFNLKIAKFAKAHNIKIFYYIAPKVWAWKEWRVKKIKKYVDELFAIFPFEVDYFGRRGINTHFFGNPLMDAIEQFDHSSFDRNSFLASHGIFSEKPLVALLAGSRRGEVRDNLPIMVEIASHFPNHQFVVAGVPWLDDSLYSEHLKGSIGNVMLLKDVTYPLLLSAEAAIVTSGTATLETALLGTPQVVCYYVAPIVAAIVKALIKIKYVSLVNIILDKESVKEVLGCDLTVENGVKELSAILDGGSRRGSLLDDYAHLRELMGSGGVSERVAEKMVELLKE